MFASAAAATTVTISAAVRTFAWTGWMIMVVLLRLLLYTHKYTNNNSYYYYYYYYSDRRHPSIRTHTHTPTSIQPPPTPYSPSFSYRRRNSPTAYRTRVIGPTFFFYQSSRPNASQAPAHWRWFTNRTRGWTAMNNKVLTTFLYTWIDAQTCADIHRRMLHYYNPFIVTAPALCR